MAERVKINYCGPRELCNLPGIGRNLSDAICDLRDSKGDLTPDDLSQVKHLHVTQALLDKIDFQPFSPTTPTSSQVNMSQDQMIARVDQRFLVRVYEGHPYNTRASQTIFSQMWALWVRHPMARL